MANSGQALPAYGLLVIFLGIMGQGAFTVIVALSLYALLPVLRNTMVGLDGVDRNVIEAGRGMGMTKLQVLARIELPLAVPIIVAGVRTAMILNIGMATLAFLIGGGGLGITIQTGPEAQPGPDPHRRRLAGRPRGPHLRLAGRGGRALPASARDLSASAPGLLTTSPWLRERGTGLGRSSQCMIVEGCPACHGFRAASHSADHLDGFR